MTRVRLALGGLVTVAALTVGPGLGLLATHAVLADPGSSNGNCVGQTVSGFNSQQPGSGGQLVASTNQDLHSQGLNFGQTIASQPFCQPQ